ncbi:hypothetical protein FRB95_012959 [Tulasnella sp. JGI-2019a]|nr:hypothetical protein FRB95_012959 [Tulasnella sp. JGI-2019a]
MTHLSLRSCYGIEPEIVLACVQRRAGRGSSSDGSREHREELPAKPIKLDLDLPHISSSKAIMRMFPDCMEWSGLELEQEDEGEDWDEGEDEYGDDNGVDEHDENDDDDDDDDNNDGDDDVEET